jgi:hypothetical protein
MHLVGFLIEKFVTMHGHINVKYNVFIRAEIRTKHHVGLEYYQRGLYRLRVFNDTVVPAFIQGVPGGMISGVLCLRRFT